MSSPSGLPLIGWRERVNLPEWNIKRIRAKIDTGARTSAIDVAQIEHLDDGRIRFEVVTRLLPTRRTQWVEAETTRQSVVKPSSGKTQERIVCATILEIAGIRHEIELSLVCRKEMLCRMLLGRQAMAGHFHVDPSRKYLLSRGLRSQRPGPSQGAGA